MKKYIKPTVTMIVLTAHYHLLQSSVEISNDSQNNNDALGRDDYYFGF